MLMLSDLELAAVFNSYLQFLALVVDELAIIVFV